MMRKREFDAVLRRASDLKSKRLDLTKVADLDDDTKARMVTHIVRNRGPVVTALIGPGTDRGWLSAMGYLYPFSKAGYNFIGKAEHVATA